MNDYQKIPKLIAYDLETTLISEGTPDLLYITAYGDDGFKYSSKIAGNNKYETLFHILDNYFLIPENDRTQFVAWNGNKFDVYFLAKAILTSDKWVIQPYMTASKSLRGMMVKTRRTYDGQKIDQFQFLDGISMTGITTALGDKKQLNGKIKRGFLSTFAPDYQKLQAPDFDAGQQFDCNNSVHVQYAERDSEGLYHGMKKVQAIINALTGMSLKPTIGNLAINYFMANVPANIELKRPGEEFLKILHGQVKRGGYCWAARQYNGPIWKYDVNQAYAAALRDAELPSGNCIYTKLFNEEMPGIYDVEISRGKKTNVPFYYKDEKNTGLFNDGTKTCRTWLTSIEIKHLIKDNWQIKIFDGFFFTQKFCMKQFVDNLELLRSTDKDGPSGPLGTMVKAIGNNAYGKTLEQLFGLEFVFSLAQPDGYILFDPFDKEAENIYARSRTPFNKKYHLPQIGVFVTAYNRCIIREAAIVEEKYFLYADTDCLAFSKPVTHLRIHKTEYGAWKQENDGDKFIIIAKKVYHDEDGTSKAKGLIIKDLTKEIYTDWLKGKIPFQIQTQRQNILKFLAGNDMFNSLERKGTNIEKSKTVKCVNGHFIPM